MRSRIGTAAIALACCVLLAYAATARSEGNTGKGTRAKVTLAQPTCNHFTVTPQPTAVKAGPVTFVVSNVGAAGHPTWGQGVANPPERHELVVLKTNLPPGKLPLKTELGVPYKFAVEVGRVAPAIAVNPGQTQTVTLNLKPGKYVLICNLFDHYVAGRQYAAFRVTSG